MSHNVNTCKVCGSINMTNFKSISNYNICYYCYTVKNNNAQNFSNIENSIFEDLVKDTAFDFSNRSNIVSINFPDINKYFNSTNYNIYDEDYKPVSASLKNGKIDTLVIPNIENINFNSFVKDCSNYISSNAQIFVGFFTSIKNLQEQNVLDSIKYIYNIYAVSKVLLQHDVRLYINDFWEKDGYILLQINRQQNIRTEKALQKSFDDTFRSNFKQEISL